MLDLGSEFLDLAFKIGELGHRIMAVDSLSFVSEIRIDRIELAGSHHLVSVKRRRESLERGVEHCEVIQDAAVSDPGDILTKASRAALEVGLPLDVSQLRNECRSSGLTGAVVVAVTLIASPIVAHCEQQRPSISVCGLRSSQACPQFVHSAWPCSICDYLVYHGGYGISCCECDFLIYGQSRNEMTPSHSFFTPN